MSGPASGRYFIVPTFLMQPSPGVGADHPIGGILEPVTLDGRYQVWIVDETEPGKYRITQERRWFGEDEAGNVVIKWDTPPGQAWLIRQFGENTYIIERDSPLIPRLVWTLRSAEPLSPVTLSVPEDLYPFQRWLFNPAPPEE